MRKFCVRLLSFTVIPLVLICVVGLWVSPSLAQVAIDVNPPSATLEAGQSIELVVNGSNQTGGPVCLGVHVPISANIRYELGGDPCIASTPFTLAVQITAQQPAYTEAVPLTFYTAYTLEGGVQLGGSFGSHVLISGDITVPVAAPLDPNGPDLTVEAIEVNQAIQNLANQAPLITNRGGIIRVYIRRDLGGQAIDNVSVQLKVIEPGATRLLPADPRYATTTAHAQNIDRIFRTNRTESVEFPYDRQPNGPITIEAEVNPNRTIAESNYSNNVKTVTVNYVDQPLHLATVFVDWGPPTAKRKPTFQEILPYIRYIKDTYPINSVRLFDGGNLDWELPMTLFGLQNLHNRVWWMDFYASGEATEGTLWAAFFDTLVPTGAAFGFGNDEVAVLQTYRPDFSLSHELGHAIGRKHVDCPTGTPAGPDPAYPYNSCHISDGTPTGYWGYQISSDQVVIPEQAADYMSYGSNNWVSDYNYRATFNWLQANQTSVVRSTANLATEYIAVTGLINTSVPTATLNYAYHAPNDSPPTIAASGVYTIELRDETDQLLNDYPIHVDSDVSKLDSPVVPFGVAIPWAENTARLVIRHAGGELVSRLVSQMAPTLTLTSLLPTGLVTQPLSLAWSASDLDGDELHYAVIYTPDNGMRWQQIAHDLTMPSITIDPSDLPGGSQARLRVLASDGINTVYTDTTTLFAIANKSPMVGVMDPLSGTIFAPGDITTLSALAFDPEDGSLGEGSLLWISDRYGVIGTTELATTPPLGPGRHQFTIYAVDSSGVTASDTIRLQVAERNFMPVVHD